MTQENRPIVGLVMGDAAGIGPEITVKAAVRPEVHRVCRLLVIGDARVIAAAARRFEVSAAVHAVGSPAEASSTPERISVLDLHNLPPEDVVLGQLSAAAARAALEAISRGRRLAESGEIQALVWAPINKQALHMVHYEEPGLKHLLEEMMQDESAQRMVQVGPLRIFGVTPHVALRRACDMITKERVLETIRLAHTTLRRLGFERPRIGVAALNPHGGEGGLFGREEIEEIGPAVETACREGLAVWGPIPGDTIFVRAKNGEFDACIAMYHDQTTMPPKLLGFGSGVSMPLGSPYPTVTTAHGTAFDIAGKGVANPQSLIDALLMAARMAESGRE